MKFPRHQCISSAMNKKLTLSSVEPAAKDHKSKNNLANSVNAKA
jgi:hypothetical protein